METDYEVSCSTIYHELISFLLASVAVVDRNQVNKVSLARFLPGHI